MRNHGTYTILCTLFLCSGAVAAEVPSYGISTLNHVSADPIGSGTRNLQTAVVITEELGSVDVPLTFFSWYQVDMGTTGKVTHQVTIYRGDTTVWTKKRTTELEDYDFTADSVNFFCDAFSEGLLPGDIVVFDFKLKGLTLEETETAELRAQLGPREIWDVNRWPWFPYDLDCP